MGGDIMFQTRLRELRETAGYKSQQAFADAFGVAQSTVGNWEAGKREPNYETTIRLSKFFNVSIDYLLGNEHNLIQDKCSKLFRHNLSIALKRLDDGWEGVPEAEYDYHKLQELTENTYPLSLKEVDDAADTVGVPLPDLLREDYGELAQEEKPTPVSEDGLDNLDKLLIQHLQGLTPDVKRMLLAQMQVMKELQQELSPSSAQE